MTDLITPHELQQAMLQKSREVDDSIDTFQRCNLRHVDADRAARIARNTALLSAEGANAQERLAKAEQAAEQPIYAEKMASALKESAREALRARLAQLNALQSLSSTIRAEMQLAR